MMVRLERRISVFELGGFRFVFAPVFLLSKQIKTSVSKNSQFLNVSCCTTHRLQALRFNAQKIIR